LLKNAGQDCFLFITNEARHMKTLNHQSRSCLFEWF